MEDHFFKLRNKQSFFPYYESLRGHIIDYSKTFITKTEEQNVLNSLYTAVMSRMFALKSHTNRISVVNLIEFMKTTEFRMKNLQNVQRKTYIQQYCDDFKSSIDNKIQTAFNLINNTIVPSMNALYKKIDEQIKDLIKETFERKDQNEEELKKAKKNKEELERLMQQHLIAGIANTVGSFLSIFIPMPDLGSIFGTVFNGFDSVFGKGMSKVNIPINIAEDSVRRIAAHTTSEILLLGRQLRAAREIFKNQNLSHFEQIFQKINITSIAPKNQSEYSPTGVLKFVRNSVDKVGDFLGGEVKELEAIIQKEKENNKGKVDEKKEKKLKALKKGQAVLGTADSALKIHETMKDDQEKIDEAHEIIEQLEHQIEMLKIHKQIIDNAVTPRLEIIEQSLNEAIEQAGNKSHVELDISKWATRSAMSEIKKIINEVTKTFTMAPEIKHSLELLDEGITAIMDVYNLLDSYVEKKQLATLIANFAIAPNEIRDDKLKWALFKIEKIIDANLLMEQYEVAINALKQHKFPFAERYLDQFQLPSNSSTVDDAFTISTINAVSELIARTQQSNSLIEEMDSYLYSNFTFVNQESFFRWDNIKDKDEIVQLMTGREVIFVANIDDGLKFNAIKFNEVWLNFKMANQTIQDEFNSELHRFSVVMEMIGSNFFRCNNRIYCIPLENTVRFSFTLEAGHPWKVNDIYSKLKNSAPFLSPYSTWKIALVSKDRDDADYLVLKGYQNYVEEISLEGRGQYLDNEGKFVYQTCNDHLDKHYRLQSVNGLLVYENES